MIQNKPFIQTAWESLPTVSEFVYSTGDILKQAVRTSGVGVMAIDSVLTGGLIASGAYAAYKAKQAFVAKNLKAGTGYTIVALSAMSLGVCNAYNTWSGMYANAKELDIPRSRGGDVVDKDTIAEIHKYMTDPAVRANMRM